MARWRARLWRIVNESRDWRIFADFAQVLIAVARPLYAGDPIGVDLDTSLYALDSTTIDLCLSLFSWARFRQHKAAIKLHTLLDPMAISQRLSGLQTAKCPMSECLTRSFQRPARST